METPINQPSQPESSKAPEKKGFSLYPERPSMGIDVLLDSLQALEQGTREGSPLSKEESAAFFNFDNKFGELLESVFTLTPITSTIYLDYLSTKEGRQDFLKTFHADLPGETSGIKKFLYENSVSTLGAAPAKERVAFRGRSEAHANEELLTSILSTMEPDGKIDTSCLPCPKRASFVLDPRIQQEKIQALRQLKETLKRFLSSLPENTSDTLKAALAGLLGMYLKRVNGMIASQFSSITYLQEKKEMVGEEGLLPEEKEILGKSFRSSRSLINTARLDKFIHGAEKDYDQAGWRKQVSQDLLKYADSLETRYLEEKTSRRRKAEANGLDTEKLFAKNIPGEVFAHHAEGVLRNYGILSKIPASSYDPGRSGYAEDGGWQVVCRPEIKSMSVSSKKKIVNCPQSPLSADKLIGLLAHEVEGHVLQHENKTRIPLRIFKKVGSGRSSLFAECGAMANESQVTKQAFGYEASAHPHYVRAMHKRLQGGDYLACLQAFYESSLKEIQMERALPGMSDEEFKNRCKDNIKLSIDRAKRLFSGMTDLSNTDPFLAESSDTAYLEQIKLFEALQARGLEKYVYVGGTNLEALVYLIKYGFLKQEDIVSPQFFSLKVWDEMRPEFEKTQPEQ